MPTVITPPTTDTSDLTGTDSIIEPIVEPVPDTVVDTITISEITGITTPNIGETGGGINFPPGFPNLPRGAFGGGYGRGTYEWTVVNPIRDLPKEYFGKKRRRKPNYGSMFGVSSNKQYGIKTRKVPVKSSSSMSKKLFRKKTYNPRMLTESPQVIRQKNTQNQREAKIKAMLKSTQRKKQPTNRGKKRGFLEKGLNMGNVFKNIKNMVGK